MKKIKFSVKKDGIKVIATDGEGEQFSIISNDIQLEETAFADEIWAFDNEVSIYHHADAFAVVDYNEETIEVFQGKNELLRYIITELVPNGDADAYADFIIDFTSGIVIEGDDID